VPPSNVPFCPNCPKFYIEACMMFVEYRYENGESYLDRLVGNAMFMYQDCKLLNLPGVFMCIAYGNRSIYLRGF
jgi:hypothetical protein